MNPNPLTILTLSAPVMMAVQFNLKPNINIVEAGIFLSSCSVGVFAPIYATQAAAHHPGLAHPPFPLLPPMLHPPGLAFSRDYELWGCQESKGLGDELRTGAEAPRLALDSLFFFPLFYFFPLPSLSVLTSSFSLNITEFGTFQF
jgi:hypothetical protein